ncbi:MAG: sigma-70 family RNA polymerase sigma factor [Angelakisella sp.]|nr:sigma-70 family RNA polymerase sigma factor [Angelakisella sp.]
MRERTNTALHPFTPAQSSFMEEHYGLLKWFLSFRWIDQGKSSRSFESIPFSFLEKEELYDVALDGYMRAVQQYDERPELREYSFTTVAVNAMRWELLRLIRKEARRRSRMNRDSSAYEAALRFLSDASVSGEAYETAEANELWDRTRKLVTVRQGNVLRLRSFGHTYAEIAERSGMNSKAVDNCLYRTRKKLRLRLAA